MSLDYIVMDIETQKYSTDVPGGFKNLQEFKVSCAVTYSEKEGYQHFFNNDVLDLLETLRRADLVIGFNLKNFDYKVLEGYTDYNFDLIPTFDILEEIRNALGHRVKLSMLALANFGAAPQGSLLKAVEWYKQGNTTKVKDYCEQDVRITHELFLKAVQEKHLKWHWHNDANRVEILDTSHWPSRIYEITGGSVSLPIEAPPLPSVVKEVPAEMLDVAFSMDFKMRMPVQEKTQVMSHDQERAFLGLVQSIHQQCEMLKNLGSPIEIYDIETSIRKPLKKRGLLC